MKNNWKKKVVCVFLVLFFISISTSCKKSASQIKPIENPPIEEPVTKPAIEETKTLPEGLYPKDQRQFAPEFDLQKLDGSGSLTLSSLKGKMILIDFTTTWCIWCTKQEPQVEDLYKNYKAKGFTVLAIDCREPKETVLGKYPGGISLYPVLLDEDGNVSGNLYGVQGYPFYLLIDKDGKVAYVQSGFKEDMYRSVSKILDYLLEKES